METSTGPLNDPISASDASRSRALKYTAAGVVLAAGSAAATYYILRALRLRKFRHRGGMKVGHDPREINLESRYHDSGEKERDVVDQAVWESFICSDPPAY